MQRARGGSGVPQADDARFRPDARLKDRVVIVTGARTGIGAATVARLAAEGALVVATARDAEALDGAGALQVSLDVTDPAAWDACVAAVRGRFGRIDGLVNNAGARASGRVAETDDDLWEEMLRTNLTSVFYGCRAVVPALVRGGAIVNVGSITGIRGTENMVAYSASKSGITTLTASVALDCAAAGIRVNAVCPAAIDTRMVGDWLNGEPDPDAAARAVVAKHPMGRIGRPEEVAGTIAFLLSDDAGFITGQSIPVDGGRGVR